MNYYEFNNKYYNPDAYSKEPGDNENWKMIQRGFKRIDVELATPFIVTFTNDAATLENPFGGHVDKTQDEIQLAYEAGQNIVAHIVSESLSFDFYLPLTFYDFDEDEKIYVYFGVLNEMEGNIIYIILSYRGDPSLEYVAQIFNLTNNNT